jgi:diketogulonate reductase-like aldo/keto reductase
VDVYRPAEITESVTLHALRIGYRHVDSARAYRNEQPCADAMRASGIPREEIFFTTKVNPRSMGYEATKVLKYLTRSYPWIADLENLCITHPVRRSYFLTPLI